MTDKLQEVKERQARAERELEDSITRLVKECWRLSLPVHYEPTTPELEEVTRGRDQPKEVK